MTLLKFPGALPAIVGSFCLASCAARPVTPVAMSQPGDDQLSCPALMEQIKANQSAATEFLRSKEGVDQANTAKAVTGVVLFGPIGLLVMNSADYSSEEQVKARSLEDRNERLTFLTKNKGCAEP